MNFVSMESLPTLVCPIRTAKTMKVELRDLTRRLLIKICIFELLFMLVLLVLSGGLLSYSKRAIALRLADAFRGALLNGENRQVMLDMPRTLKNDFYGMKWRSKIADNSFSVPPTLKSGILTSVIAIPIFFDEDEKIQVGDLMFYYSRQELLWQALKAWLFVLCLSLPIIYRERKHLIETYILNLQLAVKDSLASVAAQVAHDIRSPLAALDAAAKELSHLPEEKRLMVRGAIGRIHDIANNLIEKYRRPDAAAVAARRDNCLLSALVAPVISEKRLQFAARPEIKIDSRLESAYGLFADVNPVEFKRLLSNLINNAAEALPAGGAINVALSESGNNAVLSVSDTGKGVPPELLAKLGNKGETHGKAGGSGLGLYHARTAAESWGGSLAIESKVGKGTTATITLPMARPPGWFVPKLEIAPGTEVVILDDDENIHNIWRGRFESLNARASGVKLAHCYTPEQLKSHKASGEAVYLLDYELENNQATGLALAEELGLGDKAILVTSRSEEPHILETCGRLGIRMIPKGLAGFVPISIAGTVFAPAASVAAGGVAVLIDDDPLVHMTWKLEAKAKGIRLQAYKKAEEFLAECATLDKQTAIYIDSELGDDVKGEDIAKMLHDKGFTNIYLETGHPPGKFAHLQFIKQVLPKTPPWA